MTQTHRLLILITLAAVFVVGCSESNVSSTASSVSIPDFDPPIQIPFTLTKWNNIAIKAQINDSEDVTLMFHTDAGEVVITQEAAERCNTLSFDKDATMQSWGGESSSRFCDGNKLKIQDMTWSNVRVFEDLHSGHETDGKFGPSQFDGRIVEIDFEKSVLMIHSVLPEKANQFEKFAIAENRTSFFVDGSIKLDDQEIENEFLIHSGYSGIAMLDDKFVANNPALTQLSVISKSQVKDSMGNVLVTKQIVLPSLKIGTMRFANVPVAIFDGAIDRQKMSLLGGDLLKRMDVILDAENNAVYLRKNQLQDAKFFKS